jgi:ubiquinone/menaquinone biosynthesis C-methylase UbiE
VNQPVPQGLVEPREPSIGDVRDFWNRRPCNIRHSAREVGTREYFDEVEERKYYVEPHIPAFAQFDRWRGKKVLEIGCGIGTDSVNFARAGADLTVVELSDASLDLCRQRFATYGLEARFYNGNAEELSSFVPLERYDLIYSFGVIHHSPHPERIITELQKYCHRDTELRIMVYSRWSWKGVWIVLTEGKGAFWHAEELIRLNSEAQAGSAVTYTYTRNAVRGLLSGFDIVRIWKDHVFPYKVDKYVKYEYQWVWYLRWMPTPLFRWLERRLGWHTMVVARPSRAAAWS